jgi:hypothetical protein
MSGHRHDGAAASRFGDTGFVLAGRYCELLRSRAAHERLSSALALTQSTRELAIAGIKQRHPQADAGEIRHRLAALLYGDDVADRIFAANRSVRT